MTLSIPKLWDISLLVFESYKIPVTYLNEDMDTQFELPIQRVFSPLKSERIKLFDKILDAAEDLPRIITTEQSELFLVQPLSISGFALGWLIVGPSLPFKLREEQLTLLINDYSQRGEKARFLNYFHEMPTLNQDQLMGCALLLFFLLYEKRLTREQIKVFSNIQAKLKFVSEQPEAALSQNRLLEQFHHDPSYELKLFRTVERGDKEGFLYLHNQLPEDELGVLSKTSFLRSKKNLAISAIAIATRSAIKGGLHSEIAFTLSDLYIQRIEETFQPENVDDLLTEGMLSFIDQVKKAREHRYSGAIATCQNYIYKHLYKSISLKDLVSHVNLNPSYLSALFKKEVGMTISEFIQKAKIEEAMNLISFSAYSLTEIGNLLNFTDQSHFTKVFKKITGTTPKQFRLNRERSIKEEDHI